MDKPNFTLDQLTAFITTVESGSFKSAATKLGKHATTVSQQVAMLEVDIGFELFDRKVRKIVLTEQGHELYRYAKPVLTEASHLVNKLDSLEQNLPNSFCLALDSSIRDRQIIRCIKQVSEQLPTIEIKILSGDPLQICELVRNGEADIGISTTLFTQLPQLETKQLFNFELAYVCSPRWYPERDVIQEAELRSFPQIVFPFVYQTSQLSGHILSNHVISAQGFDDMLDLLSLNMGWAILPKFRVEEQLESGELKEFFPHQCANVNWYCDLILKADSKTNRAIELFIQEVSMLSDR
ncbi:transcriptional regulator, lysR family [Vibrio ishigakensis]|uniref:Transcriptional regulator, lysR family n=1 Tax=Vibrio ishigakensis TaxID=1481914 RepID=A0A0B8NXG4_9VIBR|nr:LysR family transcriptional regulator [Vibrio ishigakensis]GAM56967.1 transcriptional regulator, lysR family [Vibrio ishigakensis]